MDERTRITEAATALAGAFVRKDADADDRHLGPELRLRTPGGASSPRAALIEAVCTIPAVVLSVTLNNLEIDLGDGVALVTGVQHAHCRFHGELLNDVRPFADWFQRSADGRWQVRVALDLTAVGAEEL